jgi:hypothetical protein
MILKQKWNSIALVSVAITLMLVSTASATGFGNVILKTDPCTQSVDFLKFPACGDDCGCGWDPSSCDKHVNKDAKEVIKDPVVVNQYNYNNNSCDQCSKNSCDQGSKRDSDKKDSDKAPYLTGNIHIEKDPNGHTKYNYDVKNTGNAPLKGVALLDHKVIKHAALAPGEGVEFQTSKPLHLSD